MVGLRDVRRLSPRTLLLVAAALVFVASVVPGPPAEEPPPVTTVSLLSPDKLVHAGSYAGLAVLAARARARERVRVAERGLSTAELLAIAVVVTAFGAGVELAQWFVPGRTATLGDGVANAAGALVGVAAWRLALAAGDDSRPHA